MIQKEEGRRKREEGGGKQETRKLGNEAEPLDIYSQAEPDNKEAEPGREQGMQSAHHPDFV